MSQPKPTLKLKTPDRWWNELEVVGTFDGGPRVGVRNLYKHPDLYGIIRATQTFEVVKRAPQCVCCGARVIRTHFFNLNFPELGNVFSPIDVWSDNDHALTKDHDTPRSLGGTDTMDNYVTMCARCNVFKGHATGPVFCQGFIRHAHATGTLRQWKGSGAQEDHLGVSPRNLEKMNKGKICFSHSTGWTPSRLHPRFPRPDSTSR